MVHKRNKKRKGAKDREGKKSFSQSDEKGTVNYPSTNNKKRGGKKERSRQVQRNRGKEQERTDIDISMEVGRFIQWHEEREF